MSTASSSQILSLLQQREELLRKLNEINTLIIRATLDVGSEAPLAAGAGAKSGGKRRKWFERGEMIQLARKALTKPMSQADLVRALSLAKGYDKGLPSSERARFKSAAYQAIAAALEAKQLARNKAGQVLVLASAKR